MKKLFPLCALAALRFFRYCLLAIGLLAVVSGFFSFFLSCSYQNRLDSHVYYRLNANPTTLDPAFIVDVSGGSIAAKLFNGLVRLDEGLNIIPDITWKWKISHDNLTYRFFLRRDVTFINKQGVTARDFKYSFKRILDPKTGSPNTWVLEKIAGAKAFSEGRADDVEGLKIIDDHTLEIRLERPFSPFLFLLTMPAAYVVPEEEVRRWGADFSSHPVGTGPFFLAQWLPNRELRLQKNSAYFDKTAMIAGIVYRVIPEDLTAMTEFELGNLDVLSVQAHEFSRYKDDPKWRDFMLPVKAVNTYYIGLNCSRPPFDNRNVRRAMNLAIDREKLLTTFYENRGRIARGPVPDLLRKWDAPPLYPYEPEKARIIFAKEGMKGRTIHFYITGGQEDVDMAEFIQSYMREAGLDVRITQLEWSAYKEAINKGVPDMFWMSWWADYPDPEDFLFPLFHSSNAGPAGNRARFRNAEVDRLIELGQSANNEKERDMYYEKAEKIIVEEAPWVFFWHKTEYVLRQPWIKNYRAYSIYSADKGSNLAF